MQKTYTASITGLGRIAFSLGFDKLREQPASHTMALLNNRRVSIIAGCDTDKEKRDKWQDYVAHKQHKKVSVYSDMKAMLAECKADIAVVAVNEDAHLDASIAAIEARPRLVILEKPVALNSREGERIARVAIQNSVPVIINHERRFSEDYRIAKHYIESGNIGDVQSVTAELCSSLRVYSPKEADTGAYSLLHDGTHLVDITRFLLGDARLASPSLVCLARDAMDSSIVTNLCVHFAAETGTGISCPDVLIKISGRSRFFHFGVDVLGTKGRVQVGNGFARFEQRKKSKLYTGFYSLAKDKSVRKIKKTRYFSNMIQSAVSFLDGSSVLASSLQDGLYDLRVLEDMRAFCDSAQ